jgi:hypothetical protein
VTTTTALVAELTAEADYLDSLEYAPDRHASRVGNLLRTAADVLTVAERALADAHGAERLERIEAIRRADGELIHGDYAWMADGWDSARDDSDYADGPVVYELCTFVVVPGERRLYANGVQVTGLELIAQERERQADDEGFSDRHDDDHPTGALATAGECYRWAALRSLAGDDVDPGTPPPSWPWGPEWWKPGDVERDLVRAGALFQAEADRARRLGDTDAAVLLEQDVAAIAAELERHLLEP